MPQTLTAIEGDTGERIRSFTRAYLGLLKRLLRQPGKVLLGALIFLVGSYAVYGVFGHRVEFFPEEVEPEFAQVQIRAWGDLSFQEMDAIMRRVESRILDMAELREIYARTVNHPGSGRPEDIIGIVQLEFMNWQVRRPAAQIWKISAPALHIFPVSSWNSASRNRALEPAN